MTVDTCQAWCEMKGYARFMYNGEHTRGSMIMSTLHVACDNTVLLCLEIG